MTPRKETLQFCSIDKIIIMKLSNIKKAHRRETAIVQHICTPCTGKVSKYHESHTLP